MTIPLPLSTDGALAALPGASLAFVPEWLGADQADALLRLLQRELPWSVHRIRMFGREVDSPRLSAWIGDVGTVYRYSGADFTPCPWNAALSVLRARLQEELGVPFNSVLANLYRDGRDAMGWHSDDEPELGPQPLIASLSLGAPRRFLLRERGGPWRGEILLEHGSLLRMAGASQARTQHSLPKTARPVAERLNLTFRRIAAPSPPPRRRSRQAGAG